MDSAPLVLSSETVLVFSLFFLPLFFCLRIFPVSDGGCEPRVPARHVPEIDVCTPCTRRGGCNDVETFRFQRWNTLSLLENVREHGRLPRIGKFLGCSRQIVCNCSFAVSRTILEDRPIETPSDRRKTFGKKVVFEPRTIREIYNCLKKKRKKKIDRDDNSWCLE